jgi:hypothetical protein
VGKAAHAACDLGALARAAAEGGERQPVLCVGIVERFDESARERRRSVLEVVFGPGVRGHEQLHRAPRVRERGLRRGDHGRRSERVIGVRRVAALEEERDRPARPLREERREVRQRVAGVGLCRIQAQEELALHAQDDSARRVKQDGRVLGSGAPVEASVEETLDLFGEVDAGIQVDHLKARVRQRQACADQIAVEEARRRFEVGERRRSRDQREPHLRELHREDSSAAIYQGSRANRRFRSAAPESAPAAGGLGGLPPSRRPRAAARGLASGFPAGIAPRSDPLTERVVAL